MKKAIKKEPEWKSYSITQIVKTAFGQFPVTIGFYAKLPDNIYTDVKPNTVSFSSYSKKYGMNLLFPSRLEVFKEALKYIFRKH